MRIAFITPEFVTETYFSGGLANYVHRVSIALAEMGHEVHIIILSVNRLESFRHGEIWVHPITVNPRRPWVFKVTRRFLYEPGQWLSFSYKAWRRLEALHREQPIDIVQVANYRACGLFIAAFSRISNVTRLSSLQRAWHDASETPRHLNVAAKEWLECLQLRLCRHIFSPSHSLATMLERQIGINRVEVIRSPAFIETTNMDKTLYRTHLNGKRYLLFVGRYQLHKGVHILAEALPTVLDTLPDCEAVFIGKDMPNHLGPSMESYIRERCIGFEERLHFFGQTTHEQLYPIMAGARLAVLPSLVDNLPNTMLEAMKFGCPVVGTFGASFDEMIEDGISGFLVPPKDSRALANKIVLAWNHAQLEKIGNNGKAVIESLKPEIAVARLLGYYKAVIAKQHET